MPQFAPSAQKTAVAPITILPAGLSCQAELFLGPDDVTKVVSSGFRPFTSLGSPQQVTFPITMPASPGTYHVYVDVHAGGQLILAYIGSENVVISAPVVEPFAIALGTLKTITAPGYGSWTGRAADYYISNPTNKSISHHMYQHITVLYKSTGITYDMSQMWNWYDDFGLTLGPGGSYHFESLGGFYNTPDHPSYDPGSDEGAFLMIPLIGTQRIYKWWLEDELGNKSPEHVLNT